MDKGKRKGFFGMGNLRARLTFNDGFAEKPMYSVKAVTTEKHKGFDMIELIKNNFNITNGEILREDQKVHDTIKSEVEQMKDHKDGQDKDRKPPKGPFTRDEYGNIVSPFRSKRKLI